MARAKKLTIADMEKMQQHAREAANLLKKMGSEHRLLILCMLMDSELSVGQLNELIPLSQSSLSQHLSSLRDAGLVKTRRESQTIYYSLCGEQAIKIISVLHSIYCQDL